MNIIIISTRDKGFEFTIYANGEIIRKAMVVDGVMPDRTLADVAMSIYYDKQREGFFQEWCKKTFGDVPVVVCEDGDIRFL